MILKKLKLAAAVATALASVGAVHAANISQSGGTLAMETILPPGTQVSPLRDFTRVRAPAITYSYNNGPDAQANGKQSFQIQFTLGSVAKWAAVASTSGEVGGLLTPPGGVNLMSLNAALTAQTIRAQLRGTAIPNRVAVKAVDPAAGQFAIVLRSVSLGNGIVGSLHPNDNSTITYFFELVNNTSSPIALSNLDVTFNTSKLVGAAGEYFVGGQVGPVAQDDADTTAASEFGAVHNLSSLIVPTVGNQTGANTCGVDAAPVIPVRGNSGINGFQGTELDTNQVGSLTVPTYNPAYIIIRRALDVVVGKAGADRLIATTNSFAENFSAFGLLGVNLTPTNGIGGTGGGRYTFVPTRKAVQSIQFGPGLNPTVTGTSAATLAVASSGDERDAALGTVTFSNRPITASDRAFLASAYQFSAPSATRLASDFTTPTQPNIAGGVDINGSIAGIPALRLTVPFVGSLASGGGFRMVNLAALAVGSQTCAFAAANALGTLATPTLVSPGLWNIDISHANLRLAADPLVVGGNADTLNGKTLTLCYNVPGNTTIPALALTGVTATLFKDDITEQNNVSCPADMNKVYGGVKVDVRNFNMQGDPWMGILRVINNSETDTASVDAQFIWNDGTYGTWGNILPALPPRGASYVTSAQLVSKLTNVPSGLPLKSSLAPTDLTTPAYYPEVPTLALIQSRVPASGVSQGTIRVRVSADVPTLRVQNYIYNGSTQALTEVSGSQGADFVNIESSNRDHIDQDAQTDIKK